MRQNCPAGLEPGYQRNGNYSNARTSCEPYDDVRSGKSYRRKPMSARSKSRPSTLRISRHAEIRWHQRGDSRELREAIRIAPTANVRKPSGVEDPYLDKDEVRVYQSGSMEQAVFFLISEHTVESVVPQSRSEMVSGAFDQCEGCDSVHEVVFADECPYCNPDLRHIRGGDSGW